MRVGLNAMVLGRSDTGVGIWIRGLIAALAATGRDEDELLVYHGRDLTQIDAPESGPLRRVPTGVHNERRLRRILHEQLCLPGRLRRDAVDVLHAPCYVMPLRAPMPTVVTLHDLLALTHPELCKRLNAAHFRLMIPRSVRRATIVHCTSEWTRREFVRLFPADAHKAHVVLPPVDAVFRPEEDESGVARLLGELGLTQRPFLFVGNVEPKKNLPLLLEAYAEFRRRGGRRRLVMLGGRGWRNQAVGEAIERLKLGEDVLQLGYVERERLPGIYRAAVALVFPSLVEGFGLPPLEAMASGTPVVCARGAGLDESAGDAALTVEAGDADALADAMEQVSGSPELRARLRKAGLARAAHFCPMDRARQMWALYRRAAGIIEPGD
jgi:glycosyltransferase involved in cell wall biosynthesis